MDLLLSYRSVLVALADPFSSVSHLGGALVFAILGVVLVRRGRGSAARVFALSVFAFSAVLLLSLSGAYHLLPRESASREVLRRLDHAAIFVLIAGTFTPAHTILFRGVNRWGILAFVWTFAITAITLKTIFFHDVPEGLGLALYLGLGWVGLFSGIVVWRRCGFRYVLPLIGGALAYTLGAVFEYFRVVDLVPGVVGPHELFHVAVLAGIGFHWWFTNQFADGRPACAERRPPQKVRPQAGPVPVFPEP